MTTRKERGLWSAKSPAATFQVDGVNVCVFIIVASYEQISRSYVR